jgi:hypothetical protein
VTFSQKSDVHDLPCKVLCAACHAPLADEGRNMILMFPEGFEFDEREDGIEGRYVPGVLSWGSTRCDLRHMLI